MSVKQVSVFVENRIGVLRDIARVLEDASVNIRGILAADTGDFGITRLVTDRPDEAVAALEGAGFTVSSTDVLCIELPDVPGGLCRVFEALAESGLDVKCAYSLVSTFVVFMVPDVALAAEQLRDSPVRVVGQDELARLVLAQ
ncbi:MAG: ACT domain-containing protein [Coriobacteriales bacterium]|jgi:hypothetical protein|nr:ACT domain-containing protein [Coriobacteriales bacterium]